MSTSFATTLETPVLDSKLPNILHQITEEGGYAFASIASLSAAGDAWAAEAAMELAWEQLHSGPQHSLVPIWREAYAMACLHFAKHHYSSGEFKLALRALDMGLIMGGLALIDDLNLCIGKVTAALRGKELCENGNGQRKGEWCKDFNLAEVLRLLPIRSLCCKAVRKRSGLSLEAFLQEHLLSGSPVIISDSMSHWPAKDRWNDVNYLKNVAGYRTVPFQVGKSSLRSEWKQELITFSEFLERTQSNDCSSEDKTYLAQHQLFDQIQELKQDIVTPYYCFAGGGEIRSVNAWFAPLGTVTPLHHDPDHNILAQVVGKKYVRLYPATLSEELYPYSESILSNSSQVDLDNIDEKEFPKVLDLDFLDCVLEEGEMLYIPPKWWHYMEKKSMEKGRQYVVLFPFMAQGHFIPFLALAQLIEQKGYTVIFVNTPLNIKNLRRSFPPPSSIKFAEIPFHTSAHGLPPEAENTDSLSYNLILRLIEATPSLKLPFQKLLSNLINIHGGEKPLCVISDFFFGWAADVAHEFGIFHLIFSVTGGFGMACFCSMWLNLPHRSTDSVDFLLPDFPEAGRVHVTQVTPAMLVGGENDPITIFQRKIFLSWTNSDGLLLNTVELLDKLGLTYFQRKLGIPVWAIGPLLLSEEDRARTGRQSTISAQQCIQWLDQKEPNSVLYISFGSQNTIPASQMMKLAKALDASGRNFIWVVRPPLGFDINEEFVAEEWLPEGFLQRVQEQDRGLIVSKWAPQVEILAHKSVSAFISHCGWNSVLETLKYGVPVTGWPTGADQFYNAKFLVEEAGVCVEVARGTNFEISQEDIVEKIELVMGEKEEMRRKACEIKEIIRDAMREEDSYKGSSVKAMEDFFIAALLRKEKTKC